MKLSLQQRERTKMKVSSPVCTHSLMHLGYQINKCFALSVVAMKDYVYYLYFEHRCSGGKPHTDKMCVFYHKEGGESLFTHRCVDVELDLCF